MCAIRVERGRPPVPRQIEQNGNAALILSAGNGCLESVRLLVEYKANKEVKDKVCGSKFVHDHDPFLPALQLRMEYNSINIFFACKSGTYTVRVDLGYIVYIFVDDHGLCNACNTQNERTALIWAAPADHGKVDCLRLLLDAGARKEVGDEVRL